MASSSSLTHDMWRCSSRWVRQVRATSSPITAVTLLGGSVMASSLASTVRWRNPGAEKSSLVLPMQK